jgi:hypothetical protein
MIVSQNCYITATEQEWNIAHSVTDENFDQNIICLFYCTSSVGL